MRNRTESEERTAQGPGAPRHQCAVEVAHTAAAPPRSLDSLQRAGAGRRQRHTGLAESTPKPNKLQPAVMQGGDTHIHGASSHEPTRRGETRAVQHAEDARNDGRSRAAHNPLDQLHASTTGTHDSRLSSRILHNKMHHLHRASFNHGLRFWCTGRMTRGPSSPSLLSLP